MSDQTPTTPAPRSKLLPIFLIINSVLVAAVLAVVLLRSPAAPKKEEKAEHATEEKEHAGPKVGPTLKLSDFVIRLRNPEADRYARFSFEIELTSEEQKTAFTPYLPRVRDAFISYFSDRTAEELTGSEGLGRTKEALAKRIEELVPNQKITALYITDFVVQ